MARVEMVEIYKGLNDGLYKLQRKCPHPVLKGPTSIGDPEPLTENELRTSGLRLILDALASSLQACTDSKQIKRWNREAYQEFRSTHQMISISRWKDSDGNINIELMIPSEGGYRALPETKISVHESEIETGLMPAVFEAFASFP